HLGFPRVRAVHSLTVMTERLLCEALRVPSFPGPLCPRIPVGVKRNSLHLDPAAGPLEQARPVFLVHPGQTWKQEAGLRQTSQYLGEALAEMNDLRNPGFGAEEADDPVFPINVL